MRLAQADLHLQANRLQDAIRDASDARDAFKALKLPEREIAASITMAKALLEKSEISEALSTANAALSLAEEVGDQRGEALALQCIAKALGASHDIKDAIDAARKSLTIFRQSSDYQQQAASHLTVSRIHLARGRPQDALRSAKDAQQLSKRLGDSKALATALVAMAEAQERNDEQKEAISLAKEAREKFQALRDTRGEIEALRSSASAHCSMCKRNEALTLLREALELSQSISDRVSEGLILRQTAAVEFELRRLEECEQHLNEAQSILRDVQHWHGEAEVLELLLRYQICTVSKDAVSTADEWRSLYYDNNDRSGEARCVRESARMFCEAGYEQEAESRAQEAQALYQELEDKHGEAETLRLLAEVYAGFGDVQRGIQAGEEALELARSIEDQKAQSEAYTILSRVHLIEEQGNAEEAADCAEKAHQLVKRARKSWATRRVEINALVHYAEAFVAKLLQVAGPDDQAEDKSEEEQAALQAIFEKAAKASEIAVDRATGMDDRRLEAMALRSLANTNLVCSSSEGAVEAVTEGLKIAKEIGDRSLEASFLIISAEVNMADSYMGKADEQAKQALAIYRELDDHEGQDYAKSVLDQMYGTSRGAQGGGGHQAVASDGEIDRYQAAGPAAGAASSIAAPVSVGPTKEFILEGLQQLSAQIVGDDIELDAPLMEAGMDSLSSVEFRNQVRNLVPGVNLPASLVFDYPSLKTMTDYIHSKTSES
eukprot:TRINITY_DN87491_c0_g1_i1.p1 TRINITY_DN87491_c0_g1~~TRINITY_DN87491_c0_g1_i1.p1  ORF type:complete len:827 (+),score=230.44 TRINITY_DN87491_c0_g1_i1:319-2481(+)